MPASQTNLAFCPPSSSALTWSASRCATGKGLAAAALSPIHPPQRVSRDLPSATSAGRAAVGGWAGLTLLDASVQRKAAEVIAMGVVAADDFDPGIITHLRELPVHVACAAVDRLGTSSMRDVRSKAGLFMGIIRRMKEETRSGSGAAPHQVVGAGRDTATSRSSRA